MATYTHKYYLAESYSLHQHTASIVRLDNEKILAQNGFEALQFRHTKDGDLLVKLGRVKELITLAMAIKANSLVVFHFPFLANAHYLLLRILNKRRIKTAALIIDIDGLRYNNEVLLKKELASLTLFTHIIAHNLAMKDFLGQHIHNQKTICINLFDYPAKKFESKRELSKTICFAGNLSKAVFINSLVEIKQVSFNLYGQSFTGSMQPNVFYKGVFSPVDLPMQLHGSFGLVWDGNSITTCDAYLQYNTPHKLSLYLAAGLPVIVWQQSAMATFVENHGIGICIRSLEELETALNNISTQQYHLMKENIQPLQEKITNGYFLSTAIESITGS